VAHASEELRLALARLRAAGSCPGFVEQPYVLLKKHTLFQTDERSKFQTQKRLIFGLV
jgi:hypothetical protein